MEGECRERVVKTIIVGKEWKEDGSRRGKVIEQ